MSIKDSKYDILTCQLTGSIKHPLTKSEQKISTTDSSWSPNKLTLLFGYICRFQLVLYLLNFT